MIKVSVIITTHNRLELLKRAVESVMNQTYKNLEVIVVDDHSTDGTVEWCLNNRITLLQSVSKGGNAARNLGIKYASGKYVAFLDDDDYWFENKIEKQISYVLSSGCDVVYCGLKKETIIDGEITYENIYPKESNQGDVSRKILQEIFTVTSALMVRRDLLLNVGMFNEKLDFWQEYELCIRLAQESTFKAVDEILVGYFVNKSDKNRLTNKYKKWKKSVRTIHSVHKNLYSRLSILERILAKRVEIWDAIDRSENAGLIMYERINRCRLKFSFIKEKICVILSRFGFV